MPLTVQASVDVLSRNGRTTQQWSWCLLISSTLLALCGCASQTDSQQPEQRSIGWSGALLTRAINEEPIVTSYMGTQGGSGSACNTPREMLVFEPSDATSGETFPVLTFTIGLNGDHAAVDAVTVAREAARRGFVAATLDYANDQVSCAAVDQRAHCAFNASLNSSAIALLCERPLADCSRGVATAGHSLGGALAVRAKNFDPRVRATFTIGTANGNNSAACMNPGPADGGTTDRALRNHEWRLYAGETEFAENNATTRNTVTGQDCTGGAGTVDCLRADGSGWYQVANTEVADNVADHCYQLTGNGVFFFVPVVQSCEASAIDPTFLGGREPWSLGPAIDFLTGRVDPPANQLPPDTEPAPQPARCDQGVSALEQLSSGRVTADTNPFFGSQLTVLRTAGAPADAQGFLFVLTDPSDQQAAFEFLVQTLEGIEVSLRETSPGVFELCEPEDFPVVVVMGQ